MRWEVRGGRPERERNQKKWRVVINQVKVPAVAAVAVFFFLLHVYRHLTLPSSSFFNLIKRPAQQSAVHRVRWGLSISLIKQELIKGLPVPMQEKGLSHIMHNLLDKKKPLHTNKEIKSRVKSNSRGIVKSGRHVVLYTWQDLCTSAMHLYALLCLNSDKLMSSQ